MIITCPKKLELGKIYNENTFPNYRFFMGGDSYNKFAFLVIRTATLEEYRNYVKTLYDDISEITELEYFYEIHSD